MSNILRLLIFLLLVNIIFGLYTTSDENRRLYQLLKQRSAENDYEYVWFTRNVRNNDIDSDDEMKQQELRKQQQDLRHFKNFNNIFYQKNPFVENTMYESK